jgi:hypothetical protein
MRPNQQPASKAGQQRPESLPLTFYGYVMRPNSPTRAFLLDGDDIHMPVAGDMIANRYRIARLDKTAIEIEDTWTAKLHILTIAENGS